MPHFFRKPCGPGWALVGDAGCHKDPILALGVCDAFRDAELLADAVDEGLSGRRAMGDALRDYEQRRNEVSMAEYRENLHLARFQPFPEETYRLRAALREDPEATKQFFLARQEMIPRESFFNPGNLQRLMALSCLLMLLLWPCSARVADARETVTVSADAPGVGARHMAVASVVGAPQIDNLPINGRNFISFSVITPGVTTDGRLRSAGGVRDGHSALLLGGVEGSFDGVVDIR